MQPAGMYSPTVPMYTVPAGTTVGHPGASASYPTHAAAQMQHPPPAVMARPTGNSYSPSQPIQTSSIPPTMMHGYPTHLQMQGHPQQQVRPMGTMNTETSAIDPSQTPSPTIRWNRSPFVQFQTDRNDTLPPPSTIYQQV